MAGDRNGHLPAQCDNGGSLDRSPFDGNGALRIVAALSGIGQRTHRKHFAKRDRRSGSPDRSQIAGCDQRRIDHIIDEGGNAGSGERKQCDPDQRGENCVIIRHTDAELHNRIANHPEVKPTLGYNEGPTDFTPLLDHPEGYVLLSDGAGCAAVFEWSAPGVWQAHSMVLPEYRGRAAVNAALEMFDLMFAEGARMIWGMTPIDNRAAQIFNRMIGAKAAGEGEDATGRQVRFFVVEK
jgi:hypothetical protein